jgi:hypothetical protein
MAVAGYNIYLNGTKLNTSLVDASPYPLTGLTASTGYQVEVRAVDTAGNESASDTGQIKSFTTTAAAAGPTITGATLNDTNTVDATFSQGLYTNSNGTGAVIPSDFAIANFLSGGATALAISAVSRTDGTPLIGGETTIRFTLGLTGKAYGTETFRIAPASASAVYNSSGVAMSGTQLTATLTLHPTGYDYLTALQLVLDSSGLATGVANKYGTVDANNNVTKLKSIYPSAWANDAFNAATGSTGITLSNGVSFNGNGRLVYNEGIALTTKAATMHSSSVGYTDFQNTHHFAVKIGTTAEPNAVYSLMGTNGTASSNRGIAIYYDDRDSVPANHRISAIVSHGAGVFINMQANVVVPANQLFILSVEFDASLSTASRARMYVNGAQVAVTVTGTNTQSTLNATHAVDLGAAGNNILPFVGTIKEYVYTHEVDTATNRDNFINWLKGKHGIA